MVIKKITYMCRRWGTPHHYSPLTPPNPPPPAIKNPKNQDFEKMTLTKVYQKNP